MAIRKLVVVLAVTAVAATVTPSFGADTGSVTQVFKEAGITLPWDLNRSPQLFLKTLETLKFQEAYDGNDLPPNGLVKSVQGDLRIAFFTGEAGKRYLALAEPENSTSRRTRLSFSQGVALYQVSRLTGLLRRRGNQSDWRMRFSPGEVRIYQWLPGKMEPKNPRPRVSLNPSNQYANVIQDGKGNQLYNEGMNMWLIAVKVRDYLDRDGRVDAFLTRRSQRQHTYLSWEMDTTEMAHADAMVALHSDATGTKNPGGGTWTFYKDDDGKRLGTDVQMELLKAMKTVYPEVKLLGIREHWYRLYVLWNAGCPASLTEVLFHTNPKEREMLKDPKFQDVIARGVANGILRFFGFDGLRS